MSKEKKGIVDFSSWEKMNEQYEMGAGPDDEGAEMPEGPEGVEGEELPGAEEEEEVPTLEELYAKHKELEARVNALEGGEEPAEGEEGAEAEEEEGEEGAEEAPEEEV